jgi:phosphopantothenoylcysteine decarboxylase
MQGQGQSINESSSTVVLAPVERQAPCKKACNVLLCVTGSVAAIRVPELVQLLIALEGVREVRVVVTEHSLPFLSTQSPLPAHIQVLRDDDEWKDWNKLGDAVLHIELRNWADVLVVAPLSANSLAKIALGICDNLVTCIARAWHVGIRPFLVAPAMNTAMWEHPITRTHLNALERPEIGVLVIPPIIKKLACGDVGMGAMATPTVIAEAVASVARPS